MKLLTGSTLIGFLIGIFIVYLLEPLNDGAIGLVMFISISITVSIGKVFSKKRINNEDDS